MTTVRQKNVTAAQWSPNGGALGSPDLREDGYPFGANVFSPAVQKERLSKETYKKLEDTLESGQAGVQICNLGNEQLDEVDRLHFVVHADDEALRGFVLVETFGDVAEHP